MMMLLKAWAFVGFIKAIDAHAQCPAVDVIGAGWQALVTSADCAKMRATNAAAVI